MDARRICMLLLIVMIGVVGVKAKEPWGMGSKIVVGGEGIGWKYGFNYVNWTAHAGPFHHRDTLVFKYTPYEFNNGTANITVYHNVYLFPNDGAYQTCDFSKAMKLGGVLDGSGGGFQFNLTLRRKIYRFGCSIDSHCVRGMMKFKVSAHSVGYTGPP